MDRPLAGHARLDPLGSLETSFAPLGVDGDAWLFVWAEIDGGMGNNASGFERYTAVVLQADGELLRQVATVPLGDASWSRAVTEEGFHHGFTAKLLCPRAWSAGVELVPACVTSPDPRGSPGGLAQRCTRTCPKQPPPRLAGEGRYLRRGDRLVPARGARVRNAVAPGDLALVERPEPHSSELEYLELENRSGDLLDLEDLELVSYEPTERGTALGPCLVDAGERFVVDLSSMDLPPEVVRCAARGQSFSADGTIELRGRRVAGPPPDYELMRGRVLLRSKYTWDGRDWVETANEPQRAWQTDAKGRACVKPASPGLPNAPCR